MKYKISNYIIIPDAYIGNNKTRLVYSTRTGLVIAIEENTLENFRKSKFFGVPKNLIDSLIDSKILVPLEEDEFNSIIEQFENSKLADSTLNFVITPSANCQLGCYYCGQIHKKLNISQSLAEKIFLHIKNKLVYKKYTDMDIVWYGAEPLLGIKSIEYLSGKLIKLAQDSGINYHASMITNGLNLNKRNFENLVLNMNVKSFQITIDGIKESHDNSRYTKDLKPTFEIIFKNVIDSVNNPIYSSNKVSISIRVNIHKNNYKDVEKLIDYVYENNIHNKIHMNFAPVHDWGNNEADKKIGLNQDEFADLEIGWFLKMQNLGFISQNMIHRPIKNTCMTTKEDAELIDANGKISYCWEVPYTPEFELKDEFIIGDLNNENTYNNGSTIPPLRDWYNDIRNKKHNTNNCYGCTFLPICGGSCPISWYKDKPACPSFKFNIEDRLIMDFINNKEIFKTEKQ
ncbi:MAG: SPASM domain-containing protein [Gelidibacter sp.]|nr:SPASM domain-containing protein [Gelidibacter sp.]